MPWCAALCRVASRRAVACSALGCLVVVRCGVARCGAVCRAASCFAVVGWWRSARPVSWFGVRVVVSLAGGWGVRLGVGGWRGPCCGGLGVPLGLVGRVGVRGVALPGGLCRGSVSSAFCSCSSLCLPWAGARTGLHSVWSFGLPLVVAFYLAVSRPHGSGGLCTRWARRPFLLGQVLALPAGRLCQAASCGSGLGWLGFSVSFRLRGAGFNLLGEPQALLPGARWPLAGVWRAGAAPSRVCGGLLWLVLQVRVSRAVECRSVPHRVASCCGV